MDNSPPSLVERTKALTRSTQEALLTYYHESVEAFEKHGSVLPGPAHFVIRNLFVSCSMSSESVMVLVAVDRPWDGERLMRSIYEGTAKLVYMCLGSPEERAQRVQEYHEDYPASESIRRQERLEHFFQMVENPQAPEWQPLRDLLLKKDDLDSIISRYPGRRRAELQKRWSFSELLRSIAAQSPESNRMTAMTYAYGVGSSLVHQDSDGISIIWDRTNRNDERRLSIEAAHGARLLLDLLVMAQFRSSHIYRILGATTDKLKTRMAQDKELFAEVDAIHEAWQKIEMPA